VFLIILALTLVFAFAGCKVASTPVKWFDFFLDEEKYAAADLTLPEFPGVTFRYADYKLIAIDENGVETIWVYSPMNVYIADLNGDGFPELCVTATFGSGIADAHVIVIDYANEKGYGLSDRTVYDYFLSVKNGRLIVTQQKWVGGSPWPGSGAVRASGALAIKNDRLVVLGADLDLYVYRSVYFDSRYEYHYFVNDRIYYTTEEYAPSTSTPPVAEVIISRFKGMTGKEWLAYHIENNDIKPWTSAGVYYKETDASYLYGGVAATKLYFLHKKDLICLELPTALLDEIRENDPKALKSKLFKVKKIEL